MPAKHQNNSIVKLLFSGDFAPLVSKEQINTIDFSDLEPIIEKSDLHISNLECPLTDSNNPIEKSGPPIKASSYAIEVAKKAGIKIACLANNHIFDYHEQGINDTIEVCKKNGIETIGIVNHPYGQSYMIKEIEGKKIAFLNYCEHEFSVRNDGELGANGFDEIRAFYEISEIRNQVDFIIVIYHGGNEYYNLPSPYLQKIFRYFADLGANAVIGHHTHVISGYEYYKNKPLVYSLGNFFFPYPGEPESWYKGLLCELTIDTEISIEIYGIRHDKNNNSLRILKTDDVLLKHINLLNSIILDPITLQKHWLEYVLNHEKSMIKSVLRASYIQKALIKLGYSHYKLLKNDHAISTYNVLRCKSYYCLIIDSLKNLIKR